MFSTCCLEFLRKFAVSNYGVDLGDMADTNWCATLKFHPVSYQNNVATIFYDCLGHTDFSEIVIEKGPIFING